MNPTCGCCDGPGTHALRHANRSWLSAIDYRIGTFASFREDLLERLASTRELAALRSRVSDDYTIAAIEMWSAIADVITFYTERIANESFLRTATLRDSVLRLVRVIDYQLAPGAAATTTLAFTLEREARLTIPARTRVQSVPAEGETAQKYETLTALSAIAGLNRLRLFPAPAIGAPLDTATHRAIVAPDDAALAAAATLAPGNSVVLFTANAVEVLAVAGVSVADDLLTITWREPVDGTGFGQSSSSQAWHLGRSFRLFGIDAPETVVVSGRTNAADPTTTYLAEATTDFALPSGSVPTIALDARYPNLKPGAVLLAVVDGSPVKTAVLTVKAVRDAPATRSASYFDSTATKITKLVTSGSVTTLDVTGANTLAAADLRKIAVHELLGEPLRFWRYDLPDVVATGTVFVSGRRAGWSSIEVGRRIEKGRYTAGDVLDVTELAVGRSVIGLDNSGGTPVAGTIAATTIVGQDVGFEPTWFDATTIGKLGLSPGVAVAQTVLVSERLTWPRDLPGQQLELTVRSGKLSMQTITIADTTPYGTGLWIDQLAAALQVAIRTALPDAPTFAQAMVWARSDAIVVAPGVPSDPISFGPSERDARTVVFLGIDPPRARFLDGLVSGPLGGLVGTVVNGWLGVRLGVEPAVQKKLMTGVIGSLPALATAMGNAFDVWARARSDGRILLVPPTAARTPRSFLRLDLDTDAPLALATSSAVLLGNVATASHGETVRAEIVGDGDGSQTYQRYPLRKAPVTYVPGPVPGGVVSSLQLTVNGALWSEVPTLFGADPTDEVFTTRLADDGVRTIHFGDGIVGARLPSGRQNVVATYRRGIGVAGRVGAGKLTTLLDRPTGLKSATNPLAADGGADPETLARARRTAPGTVRTFGRAISLLDFEDTTLVAGEVAKARADWIWTGRRRIVHLTVAGQGGSTFSTTGLARLVATLQAERDPNHPLLMSNYTRVAVLVAGTVIVDPRYVAATVRAAARAALLDMLSFDRRGFAESVDLSDVYAVLQDVPGVLAVDLDRLDLKSTSPSFRKAHGVDDTKGQPQARLRMLPAQPSGAPGGVLPSEIAWVEVPALDVVLQTSGGIVE